MPTYLTFFLMSFLFFSIVFNLLLLFNLFYRKKAKYNRQIHQEYGEYLEALVHQFSARQHEFANQINVMMGLAQSKKMEDLAAAIIDYGERILDEKKRMNAPLLCDDSMVAAMLYRKKLQADKESIQFECLIEEPFPQYSVSPFDLVELIVNMINNAFEAVAALPVPERQVFLKISKNSIEVINAVTEDFDQAAIINFGKIGYSTKGKQRGYGVSNIQTIVNRYHGSLDVYLQENMLVFALSLP
jgi:two-component system sensor histidine kinase AgrC